MWKLALKSQNLSALYSSWQTCLWKPPNHSNELPTSCREWGFYTARTTRHQRHLPHYFSHCSLGKTGFYLDDPPGQESSQGGVGHVEGKWLQTCEWDHWGAAWGWWNLKAIIILHKFPRAEGISRWEVTRLACGNASIWPTALQPGEKGEQAPLVNSQSNPLRKLRLLERKSEHRMAELFPEESSG